MNEQKSDEMYLNMEGSNKAYLDMNTTDTGYLHPDTEKKDLLPDSHYDNIRKIRALDHKAEEIELKPILCVPKEEETRLSKSRSGNLDNFDGDYNDNQLTVRSTPLRKYSMQHNDFDEELFINKEPFHKKVSNESVTSDASSGFHSDLNYEENLNPPTYSMVMENTPAEIAV